MDAINIPIIKRETNLSKSCKMIYITGVIIILTIVCLHYQKKNFHEIFTLPDIIEIKKITNPKTTDKCIQLKLNNHNNPVLGKYIQLINLNKQVPIKKIVVIDSNKIAIELFAKKVMKNGKTGISIEYELPKPVNIVQIIIDTNMFDKRSLNIVTTQVKIKNKDNCIVWSYNKPLNYTRYNYVYIVESHVIHPVKSQTLLHPVLSDCENELILKQNLILNTWV